MKPFVFDPPANGLPRRPRLTMSMIELSEKDRRSFVLAEAKWASAAQIQQAKKRTNAKCKTCLDSGRSMSYQITNRGAFVFDLCPVCRVAVSNEVAAEGAAVLRAQELNLAVEHLASNVMGPRWRVRWANTRGADATWSEGIRLSEAVADYEKVKR